MRSSDDPIAHDAALDAAFAAADFIVEGEYRTGAQEQLYIENNGVIAEAFRAPDGSLESVTVSGSMQCPYYLVHALELVFHLPAEKCRVIQTETGGAFGGKEDFPSVIGSHAALLAMKSGHPVKICYDRAEDLIATTKRHPSRTRHRTAVSRDGKLLAGEIEVVIDGGAYVTLSPVVLSRATIHAPGPYRWPHLTVRAKAMATNVAPHGAFRGFGAPQSLFALERHMDKIASVVGLTPEELRRRNFLATGDHTATGQHLSDPVDMQHLLTRALEESNYHAKRAEFDRTNPTSTVKRGIGFASFMHGSGFTGSGERRLNSLVKIELTAEGRPRILVSSTEFGQGTNTILSPGLRADAPHPLRRSPRRPARHLDRSQLRPHRRQPDCHDRRQAGRARIRVHARHPRALSRKHRANRRLRLLRRLRGSRGLHRQPTSSAPPRLTWRSMARSSPKPATRLPATSSGTTISIAATPTPPTHGPYTSLRSPSTRSPTWLRSPSSTPCRRSARSSIPSLRRARWKAASPRASAMPSTKSASTRTG